MKHKLINFDRIVNNLIVHNLLINFHNRENKFGIQKNISESKKQNKRNWEKKYRIEKKMKADKNISGLRKKIQNREKYFRKLFQNWEVFCYKNRGKIFGTESFYNIFAY